MLSGWLPLLITLLIQSMVSMALLTLPVMAPVAAKSLQVSPALVGPYVAVSYGGALMATLLGGAMVARWGPIRVSQMGLLLCAVGLLLCALPWLPAVVMGAVLIGWGYGPITPASSHLLARTTPADRMAIIFSVKQTGVPLGGILAGVVVPLLLLQMPWQAGLALVAAACVLCALLAQQLRAAFDVDLQVTRIFRMGSFSQPLRLVLAHRPLLLMAACSFVFSVVQMSLSTYLVTYLYDDLAYGLVAAGLALSLTQFGGVFGRIAWGYVADRWLGASRMLTVLAVVMALCALATAALSVATPKLWVWIILIVFGASAIGWNGVYLAEVARQSPPGKASMATGGTLAFNFLGVVIGAPLFGAVSSWSGGYRAGFLMLAVVAAGAALLLILSHRKATAAPRASP
jgi:predicted MFS family arabinose efflux permease